MRRWMMVMVMVLVSSVSYAQQERDRLEQRKDRQELQQRIQTKFDNMLREELQLTDQQEQLVMPEIHRLEEAKRSFGRERMGLVRSIREGLRDGASDKELADMMEQLDALELRRVEMEQDALQRINADLSVRQQAQFRFFVDDFRRELRSRLERRNRLGEAPPHGKRPPRGGR